MCSSYVLKSNPITYKVSPHPPTASYCSCHCDVTCGRSNLMKRGLFWIKVLRKLIIVRGRHGFFSGSVFSEERYGHQSPVTSFHTKKRVLAKVGPGYPLRPVPTILNTHVDPKSKRYHCLSKEYHELGTRCWKA